MDRTRSGSRATSDDDNPASYFARPDLTLAPVPPRAQDFESGSLLQDPTFDLPHRGKKKRAASLSRLFGHVGRELRHDITDMRLRRSASHSRARTRSPGDDRPAPDSLRRSGSSPERDGFESESPQNSAPRGLFSREARRQSRERQQQQQATISSPRSPSFSRRRADSAPAFPRSPTWRDDPGTSASRHRDSTRGAWDGSNGEVTDSGDPLRRPKHSAALTTTSDKKLSQTSATQTGPETPDSSASRPHVFIPRASSALDDPVTESISPAGQPQQSLFKATFSPRQLARLQRASKQVERHDRKIANKGLVGAEFKVALGLFDVLNKEKKEQRRARGQGKAGGGALEGERHGSAGLAGLAHQLEQQVEHRLGGVEHDLRESGHRFEEGHGNRASVALGVGGGAAALVGLVGAGYEMWQQEMKRREEGHEQGVVGSLSGRQRKDSVAKEARGASRPAFVREMNLSPDTQISTIKDCAKTAPDGRPSSAAPLRDHEFSLPHLPASLTPRAVPPHPTTPYLSSLTPAQHHLVQHAAAALLLKDHTHGNLHEKLHRAVGGFDKMVQLLEVGMEKAWTGVSEHAGTGIGSNRGGGGGAARRPKSAFHFRHALDLGFRLSSVASRAELFGTPLPVVTHHEGVDSFHGADPHGTVRIPEFIDHCITALMQAGTCHALLICSQAN